MSESQYCPVPDPTRHRMAVVGVGAIGSGVAQCFAAVGYDVVQLTRDGADRMGAVLQRQVARGTMTPDQADELMERMSSCTIDEVPEVELVVEAVSEDFETKVAVLQSVASRVSEQTVLASSTSTIPISSLAESLPVPSRVVGMHFMTPVPRMRLVEVIRGAQTSDEVVARVEQWCREIDKVAAWVNDQPGFVASRLAQAVVHEAVHILSEGEASAEVIDIVATLGLNMPVGPLRLLDEVGVDVALRGLDSLYELLGHPRYDADPLLRELLEQGRLGRKSGCGIYQYAEVAR